MTTLGYQFISLSPEQVQERRKILDRNGFYAYLSPIIILLGITLYQALVNKRWSKPRIQLQDSRQLSSTTIRLQRLKWWLADPIVPEFGSRQVLLVGFAYTAWLLFLSFRQTSNDYMHLTKQLGHIAISQLPVHYALAVKSTMFPVQKITGLTHESILPYHRLFGRVVHVLLIAHSVLYLNFFKQANLLPGRLASRDAGLGIVALLMFNVIGVTSIPPIRQAFYHKVFYRAHVILPMLVLPVLFFHVNYTRIYVAQCFFLGAFNAITRKVLTTPKVKAKVESIAGDTSMLSVTVSDGIQKWTPGQHCYLKQELNPLIARSPFTIVSLAQEQGKMNEMQLVLRSLGGPLSKWVAAGAGKQEFEVMIEGPYGAAAEYVPNLIERDDGDVLLVAGGVGATFTVPVYIGLIKEAVQRKAGIHGHLPLRRERKVDFVWVVKSQEETLWALQQMQNAGISDILAKSGIDANVRIFVTNNKRPSPEPLTSHFLASTKPVFDFPPTGNSVINTLSCNESKYPSMSSKKSTRSFANTSSTFQFDQQSEAFQISTRLRRSRMSNNSVGATSSPSKTNAAMAPPEPAAAAVKEENSTSDPHDLFITPDPLAPLPSSQEEEESNNGTTTSTATATAGGNNNTNEIVSSSSSSDDFSTKSSPLTTPMDLETTDDDELPHLTNAAQPRLSPPARLASGIATSLPNVTLHSSNNNNNGDDDNNNNKRPNLKTLLAEIMSSSSSSSSSPSTKTKERKEKQNNSDIHPPKITILTCGPSTMTSELREEVGKYVWNEQREIEWHSENFAHG